MKLYVLILSLILTGNCLADVPRIMPALSRQRINSNFTQAQNGFEQRWQDFARNKTFNKYTPNYSDKDVVQQFSDIKKARKSIYYENPGQQPQRSNPDYERSQLLMSNGYFMVLHHIAFEYNASHPSYNSSNVTLNGHRFLALEGPQKPTHVNNFLRLLVNYDVKQLVRLTNDFDNGSFRVQNYWQGKVITQNKQNLLSFNLEEEDPTQTNPYSILYYATNDWKDFSGTDADLLFNLVQSVRADYKPGEIMAVHCRAGVGRTGTVIAAFLLLEDIDKQLANGVPKDKIDLSIEELVYKLSLQRAYAVAEPEQYLNLHQMVKKYIASK